MKKKFIVFCNCSHYLINRRCYMKIIVICVVILFIGTTLKGIQIKSDTTAKPIMIGSLVPRAMITDNNDIFCVATRWSSQFPLIAEKIDSNGKLLWNGISLSTPQKTNDSNGNAFMLPCSDGGAYFAFEYHDFRKWENGMDFVARYPHIQRVDAKGKVMWGAVGKRLSDILVDVQGGATIRYIYFAPDGDIIIYWTWFNDHFPGPTKNEFGTFVQKVDPVTGELKFGKSGKKLFNFMATLIKQAPNGNIYIFQDRLVFQNGGDSVACFNASVEKLWQIKLLSNISNNFNAGTNNYGELIIVYDTSHDIRASLFDKNGLPIWGDKIISSTARLTAYTITQWGKEKWIFTNFWDGTLSIICLDRNGNTYWGESGKPITDQTASYNPINDKFILVAFQKLSPVGSYVRDLYMQKLDKNGNSSWNNSNIKVFQNVSTNCIILPDKKGGAYLIFDALQSDTPQYQARGTYLQKVDANGNLGLLTSIKNNQTINNTASTTSVVCYPNPSNGIMTFQLKTKNNSVDNALIIYDILGREVRRYNFNSISYGETLFHWDGKNSNGIKVVPGIYFYYMKTKDNINLSGKIIRIR